MFDPQTKDTGTRFTTTVALLTMAFVFIPAVLIISGRFGDVAIALTAAGSAACIFLAWVSWTKYSQLTIPSIETPAAKVK